MKTPCPLCGSTHFGSSVLPDGSLRRWCHGYFADTHKPCRYTWHQSEDHLHLEPEERGGAGMMSSRAAS